MQNKSDGITNNSGKETSDADLINETLSMLMKKQTPGTAVDISYDNIARIFKVAQGYFLKEGPLLNLNPPIRVIGDVHGQVHDILTYFETFGHPSITNYLFLGDYIDRGLQSLETVVLLCCLKIVYPERIFILRGNHETPECDQRPYVSNCLKRELLERFRDQNNGNENTTEDLMVLFFGLFDYLPLCAIIGRKIFAVHGCVTHDMKLTDIMNIKLPCTFPMNQKKDDKTLELVRNLLWSDPMNSSTIDNNKFYIENNVRRAGYCVNEESVKMFLDRYKFDILLRGHEAPRNGLNYSMGGRVLTLFGASNYKQQLTCSSVMVIDSNLQITFVNYSFDGKQ